jgi:two-component system NarL family sensor kinase
MILMIAVVVELTVMCLVWPDTLTRTGSAMGIFTAGASLLGATILARLALANHRTARLKKLLQRSFQRLAGAQKAERDRIARELHDGISQMLICIRHTFELAAEPGTDPKRRAALLGQGLQQLHEAITEVRRVSHGYKSVLLNDRDFTQALRLLGNEFSDRTRIQTDLDCVDAAVDDLLNTSAKGALLRIVQEALTNVQRHSGASRVQLAVQPRPDHVELRVVDNGSRRAPCIGSTSQRRGIGISNMQERAAALGGTLSVRFTGSHTEVVARVPPTTLMRS